VSGPSAPFPVDPIENEASLNETLMLVPVVELIGIDKIVAVPFETPKE
jgi:hypothetical protein